MKLEKLKGLRDEVAQVLALTLRVVDLVTLVQVFGLEEVKDGEDLTVVGHESLSDRVTGGDEELEDLQGGADDRVVARVERS